ncbi:MAG TPA: NAD(P)H-binding protein [Solirubrobacteraceae bacterium]|nr:NAD(P)H-binding protein [Solirubrobacteraceae bacterium]
MAVRALVTGVTGFVGQRLTRSLLRSGARVRCLARNPAAAADLARSGAEVRQGDVMEESSLNGLGDDIDVAYYLIHSMADGPGFRERELAGAINFARMATRDRVSRVVYLGGLGDQPSSAHLRSRHETALALAAEGPPLTYFRAGMIVGSGSESYTTLRYLVKRLPVMVAPRWLRTATQPIGIDDTIGYLASAPEVARSSGREVQIGGPDVLSYAAMLDRMALAMGVHPRPKLPVPLITPWLSALWLGLVTPVDTNVARPLVAGLTTETVVTDTSGSRLFAIEPLSFDESLRIALAEELAPRPEARMGRAAAVR